MMTKSTSPRRVADSSVSMNRRALLGRTAALAAATVLVGPVGSRAQQKMSKQAAQYQDSPKGDQKCAACRFLSRTGHASWSKGKINPDGWCRLYQPKA